MRKIITLLLAILMYSLSYGQTPIPIDGDGYTDWLFVNSDKALQVRYKLAKAEEGIGYFEVQFRINFEDEIFCSHPNCAGYLLVHSYPSLDNQNSIETSYKFYNTVKTIYTATELMPVKLSLPDGSQRMLRKEGLFYNTQDNNNKKNDRYLFSNCVDDILANNPDYHRCKPYKSNFKDAEAIVLE